MSIDPTSLQHKSVRTKLQTAFTEAANVVGVAGVLAASLALLNPIPFLVGLVLESAYLLFVPDSKWFAKRLDKKFDEQIRAQRRELKNRVFPKIRREVQSKYEWLEGARSTIENQATTEDPWFSEALRKLDFLLEKYLQFADRESAFLNYLVLVANESYSNLSKDQIRRLPEFVNDARSRVTRDDPPSEAISFSHAEASALVKVIEDYYSSEIDDLNEKATGEVVVATQNLLQKRCEVLGRRKEFVVRLGEILINLRHQMDLISETFGLINDEIRARSPEQVLADINDVVNQATSLTDAIDEITPTDQLVAKIG